MHLSIYKSQIGSDLICTPIWLPLQSFAHQTLFTDIFKAFAEIESMAIVEQCTSYVHSLIHITRDKKSSDVIQAMDEVQVMAVNVSARATSLYYAMFFIHFITTLFGGIELGRERRLDWRLVKHNAGRWLNSDIIFESFFLFLFFFLDWDERYRPFDRLILRIGRWEINIPFDYIHWAAHIRPVDLVVVFSYSFDHFSLTMSDYFTVCMLITGRLIFT